MSLSGSVHKGSTFFLVIPGDTILLFHAIHLKKKTFPVEKKLASQNTLTKLEHFVSRYKKRTHPIQRKSQFTPNTSKAFSYLSFISSVSPALPFTLMEYRLLANFCERGMGRVYDGKERLNYRQKQKQRQIFIYRP